MSKFDERIKSNASENLIQYMEGTIGKTLSEFQRELTARVSISRDNKTRLESIRNRTKVFMEELHMHLLPIWEEELVDKLLCQLPKDAKKEAKKKKE